MNTELAHRLGIDVSVLDGMMSVLERKGVLSVPSDVAGVGNAVCSGSACGTSCAGLASCPFVADLPTPIVVA